MIFDLIIGVGILLVTGFLGLIPAYTPHSSITSFGDSLGGSLAMLNGFFPVATLGFCIGVIVAFKVFTFAWSALVFVYDRVPFKAS